MFESWSGELAWRLGVVGRRLRSGGSGLAVVAGL
jgi:hypothetical protein